MELKKEVLSALSSCKRYISGEELAKQFGKSRAAVWKAVKALKKGGYIIDAVTNKGYILTEDNDILSAESIKQNMKHKIDVLYYPSVDSTNSCAKSIAAGGDSRTLLITADEQTAGRGRQGKSFYSPPKTGIYMTLVIHPDLPLQNAVTATTAASVAVCRAVEKLTRLKPEIKWVNDVYLNGNKICGILTEAVSDFEAGIVTSVIIGIGMN
ncbi:MAG: biotin--[acetyl-CoA-carboxylase] ligase, partial [Clostridiales bacterium]|nr:biotin--[acetyl-CoA-carboxylase] ligase [Clostridiales bacterium]